MTPLITEAHVEGETGIYIATDQDLMSPGQTDNVKTLYQVLTWQCMPVIQAAQEAEIRKIAV